MTTIARDEQLEESKRKKIFSMASTTALRDGVITFAVVGAATVLGAAKSKKFDKITSISAKVSFPVMASIAIWSFRYETLMIDAKRFPEKYGIYDDDLPHAAVKARHSSMPIHHSLMNYIYDHPFQMIAGLGIPLTGTILYSQRNNTHLTLSQKIMHSRVFAQGSVLAILLTTMGFREYMDRNGRFPDPAAAPVQPSDN